MDLLHVNIKLINQKCCPFYSTNESAGMDCLANISEIISIPPKCQMGIPLGFATELPKGYYADVRPRSGLAIKNCISITNSPGTIDSDYRKEWVAIIRNNGDEYFYVHPLMKICQILILPYPKIILKEVDELTQADETHEGFGSTNANNEKEIY